MRPIRIVRPSNTWTAAASSPETIARCNPEIGRFGTFRALSPGQNALRRPIGSLVEPNYNYIELVAERESHIFSVVSPTPH